MSTTTSMLQPNPRCAPRPYNFNPAHHMAVETRARPRHLSRSTRDLQEGHHDVCHTRTMESSRPRWDTQRFLCSRGDLQGHRHAMTMPNVTISRVLSSYSLCTRPPSHRSQRTSPEYPIYTKVRIQVLVLFLHCQVWGISRNN